MQRCRRKECGSQTEILNMCFCENFIMPGIWEGADRNGKNAMEIPGVTTT